MLKNCNLSNCCISAMQKYICVMLPHSQLFNSHSNNVLIVYLILLKLTVFFNTIIIIIVIYLSTSGKERLKNIYIKYTFIFYDRSGQFRGFITHCAVGLALCTASSCVSGCRHRSPKINNICVNIWLQSFVMNYKRN